MHEDWGEKYPASAGCALNRCATASGDFSSSGMLTNCLIPAACATFKASVMDAMLENPEKL